MRCQCKHAPRGRQEPPASGRPPLNGLGPAEFAASAEELVTFHRSLQPLFQRREQWHWSAFYLCGQLADVKRKTIEGMVLALKGPDANAMRAVQQFISQGRWPVAPLLQQHHRWVAEWLGEPEGVVILDGSGFPKQGPHSVGVARQYCGQLGKVANCQEGVFAVYVTSRGYTFLDQRLYLPEEWFDVAHQGEWRRCGLPPDVRFHTESELGLEIVHTLVQAGQVPFRWVTADEHFGQNPVLLDGIAALGKWYLLEVPGDTRVWRRTPPMQPPGRGLLGRPRTRARVAPHAPLPQEVRQLAAHLPKANWQRRIIKEGSKGTLVAEFACLRVTTIRNRLPGPRVWLVLRRRLGARPTLKCYLSNAPLTCALADLVRVSGLRWPIETALEEGKQELGMDEYETRSWTSWHHHMIQTFLAHLFLMRLRVLLKKKSGPDRSPSTPTHCQRARRGTRTRPRHL